MNFPRCRDCAIAEKRDSDPRPASLPTPVRVGSTQTRHARFPSLDPSRQRNFPLSRAPAPEYRACLFCNSLESDCPWWRVILAPERQLLEPERHDAQNACIFYQFQLLCRKRRFFLGVVATRGSASFAKHRDWRFLAFWES